MTTDYMKVYVIIERDPLPQLERSVVPEHGYKFATDREEDKPSIE